MYSVSDYGRMIDDRPRFEAYAEALRRAVRPDSVVLDLGAGTGIMSLLACRFGARRVFAIESDDAIAVARQAAADNGFADRIEFFQGSSTEMSLPEPADVVVSDLRGVLPFFQQHLISIADGRRRLLRPGGVLIGLRDTIRAALVDAPEIYATHVTPAPSGGFGLNLEAARSITRNTWRKARIAPAQLLVEPQDWFALDYRSVESPHASASLRWTFPRDATTHGFAMWFDAELAKGVGLSNGPGQPETIYGQAFFPFLEPLSLAAGDTVTLLVQANLVGADYVWRWKTRVEDAASKVRSEWEQSTFHGVPFSLAQLRKQSADYVPALNPEGEADYFILNLFRQGIAVGEIARRLAAEFPAKFPSETDALTRVGELSRQYSR